jgi:primosomal protein N' (replication factor Y)
MQERLTLFVDVIVPVPIHQAFTYRVHFEMNEYIKVGARVLVPFGRSKILTGLVVNLHETPPKGAVAKYIEHLLDEHPIVVPSQLKFWKWMSSYYLAPLGDVMNAALPSNLKLASETIVIRHPDFDEKREVDDKVALILDALDIQENLTLKDITEILGIATIQPHIKKWLDQGILMTLENIRDKFSTKTAAYVELNEEMLEENIIQEQLEYWTGKKSKASQMQAFMTILADGGYSGGQINSIAKKELEAKGISPSTLKTLEKNGVIRIYQQAISRLSEGKGIEHHQQPVLTEPQGKALDQIRSAFQEHVVCLLNGVTGSGKTEIYIHLIEEHLKKGDQVLFLVPEIALTTQLVGRLTKYFGEAIGVYHSKFNQNERIEIWNKVLDKDVSKYRIILGARSSIFLPFQQLGLIIVDEEQESSFKQHDPSPRYNGRDCAVMLGHMHGAKVLMGSATPSMESYWNALNGKYALVELHERYQGMELPEILVADLKKERKRDPNFQFFSAFLIDEIRQTLKNGEQVILFQNRRGYNPRWECEVCSWTPHCINCDVSLTYHKNANALKCHYCGHFAAPMGACKDCGSNRLKMVGFGTEKIEDEIQLIFPNAVSGRLDLDTTRNKNGYENVIEAFSTGQIDILIGTQMISKGLDFDNVQLVGIMDADSMLNRPDFRAYEKAFQMMTQVAGRSGRKKRRGKVIIQTGQVEHWVIEKVHTHDFIGFYEHEQIERKNFLYPPYSKMIDFTLKHRDEQVLNAGSMDFANRLKAVFDTRIIGPEFAIVPRVNNKFIKNVKLKLEKGLSEVKVKEKVHEIMDQFYSISSNKSIQISIDVDPV